MQKIHNVLGPNSMSVTVRYLSLAMEKVSHQGLRPGRAIVTL